MRFRPLRHGEHFTIEEFTSELRAALDFEVFRLSQPVNWIGDSHENKVGQHAPEIKPIPLKALGQDEQDLQDETHLHSER